MLYIFPTAQRVLFCNFAFCRRHLSRMNCTRHTSTEWRRCAVVLAVGLLRAHQDLLESRLGPNYYYKAADDACESHDCKPSSPPRCRQAAGGEADNKGSCADGPVTQLHRQAHKPMMDESPPSAPTPRPCPFCTRQARKQRSEGQRLRACAAAAVQLCGCWRLLLGGIGGRAA